MNKRKLKITCSVLAVALIGFAAIGLFSNRAIFDTTWSFEQAQIAMPDGSMVSGKLESWKDFDNSDCVQVKIGGKVYLTHYTNVVLISD